MKSFDEFKEVLKDEAFRRELAASLAKSKPEDKAAEIAAIIEFASEKGFAVTAEELSVDAAGSRELSDEEAENVVGGVWCLNDYTCVAAWYHDQCSYIWYFGSKD